MLVAQAAGRNGIAAAVEIRKAGKYNAIAVARDVPGVVLRSRICYDPPSDIPVVDKELSVLGVDRQWAAVRPAEHASVVVKHGAKLRTIVARWMGPG